MAPGTEREQAVGTLAALIRQTRIAMLTTLTEEGAFRSRPITTHGARFDGDLWFLTRVDSAKPFLQQNPVFATLPAREVEALAAVAVEETL